jgi:hypothetical protein
MGQTCYIEDMEKAGPYTKIYKKLYMGSREALHEPFDVYVSMARSVRPPKSIPGISESMWIKMDDVRWDYFNDPYTQKVLLEAAAVIANLVRTGHSVVIVCEMGMNRSGLMTGLVLMTLGMSASKAVRKVRKRGRCALHNQSFVDFLYDIGG